jgi:hypothetical protein
METERPAQDGWCLSAKGRAEVHWHKLVAAWSLETDRCISTVDAAILSAKNNGGP